PMIITELTAEWPGTTLKPSQNSSAGAASMQHRLFLKEQHLFFLQIGKQNKQQKVCHKGTRYGHILHTVRFDDRAAVANQHIGPPKMGAGVLGLKKVQLGIAHRLGLRFSTVQLAI